MKIYTKFNENKIQSRKRSEKTYLKKVRYLSLRKFWMMIANSEKIGDFKEWKLVGTPKK